MEVSHFELIFKPQSARGTHRRRGGGPADPGYFLAITNLEDVEYRYRLEFVATPPPPAQPQRSLAGNTLVFIDNPGTDNQQGVLTGGLANEVFRPSTGLVRIAPRTTALVAVLPSAFGPFPGEPTPLVVPNFEVRGYVRISLPALFPPFGGGGGFFPVPQAAGPVRVLLTPQNRTTFFTAAGVISDQTQASLPLAGGNAIASLPPEPGGPVILPPFLANRQPFIVAQILEMLPDLSATELLAGLMAQLDPATADFTPFNRALADAGIGVALERRKLKP